jgi:hypothetical protein
MVDEQTTPTRGVKDVLKAEFSKFWKDPLMYSFERWVYCFFLAIAICILASGVKMLVSAGMYVVAN